MKKIFIYNYNLNKELLDNELKNLALFKLGDPVLIDYLSVQLSIKILNHINTNEIKNFIIIGPPPNKLPSSSHILIKKVAQQLNIKYIFPKRLGSADGYSKLKIANDKKKHISQQFTFENITIKEKSLIIDDVSVSGEMFFTLNRKLKETNNSVSNYLATIWNFNDLPVDIENSIANIVIENAPFIFERIKSKKWYLTSGLEKYKKYLIN
jgi:hypothetical protein